MVSSVVVKVQPVSSSIVPLASRLVQVGGATVGGAGAPNVNVRVSSTVCPSLVVPRMVSVYVPAGQTAGSSVKLKGRVSSSSTTVPLSNMLILVMVGLAITSMSSRVVSVSPSTGRLK